MKQYIKLMLVLAFASAGISLQAMNIKIEDYTWSDADCAKNKNITSPNTRNAISGKLTNIATAYSKASGADKDFWGDVAALLITNVQECYNTNKSPRAADSLIKSLFAIAQGKGTNKIALFSAQLSQEELELRAALALGQDALNTGSTVEGFDALAQAISRFNKIYGQRDSLYDRAITLVQKLINKTKGAPVVQETPEEKALEIALDKALTALVKATYLNADDSLNKNPNLKASDAPILVPLQKDLVTATLALKNALANKGLNPFSNARYLLADTIGNMMIDAIQKIQSLPGSGGQKPPTPPAGPTKQDTDAATKFLDEKQKELFDLGAVDKNGNETQGALLKSNKGELEKVYLALMDQSNPMQTYIGKLVAAKINADAIEKRGLSLIKIAKKAYERATSEGQQPPVVTPPAVNPLAALAKTFLEGIKNALLDLKVINPDDSVTGLINSDLRKDVESIKAKLIDPNAAYSTYTRSPGIDFKTDTIVALREELFDAISAVLKQKEQPVGPDKVQEAIQKFNLAIKEVDPLVMQDCVPNLVSKLRNTLSKVDDTFNKYKESIGNNPIDKTLENTYNRAQQSLIKKIEDCEKVKTTDTKKQNLATTLDTITDDIAKIEKDKAPEDKNKLSSNSGGLLIALKATLEAAIKDYEAQPAGPTDANYENAKKTLERITANLGKVYVAPKGPALTPATAKHLDEGAQALSAAKDVFIENGNKQQLKVAIEELEGLMDRADENAKKSDFYKTDAPASLAEAIKELSSFAFLPVDNDGYKWIKGNPQDFNNLFN